ncbi:unnamed protein product, partial [Iphiclides podalirius]
MATVDEHYHFGECTPFSPLYTQPGVRAVRATRPQGATVEYATKVSIDKITYQFGHQEIMKRWGGGARGAEPPAGASAALQRCGAAAAPRARRAASRFIIRRLDKAKSLKAAAAQ